MSFTERARGAVLGQFIGDAMALGSHWHYNLRERDRLYPGGIQGFEQPASDHYHKTRKPGEPTHYGDAALIQLESLVAAKGFDAHDFGMRFTRHFDDPSYRGYLDKPTRLTIQAFKDQGSPADYPFDAGPDDFQTVTMCRLAPLVVRYAKVPELDRIIVQAVRVNQNNPQAIAHNQVYAAILKLLLQGVGVKAAIEQAVAAYSGPYEREIHNRFDDALAMADETVINATGLVGRSCYLPCTFPSILHASLRHADEPDKAILETVRAGGDNASRAAIVGAWMGAVHGIDVMLPMAGKLGHRDRVLSLTDELLAGLS